MRFAYADPPYLGCCNLYGHDHREPYGCWDHLNAHGTLIETLAQYDGWAMSLSSPSLDLILNLCPPRRVGVWVKPFAIFKPNVGVAYAWEPVIFVGGRRRTRSQPTVPDWIAANITLKKGLTGAKPIKFCNWVLDVLNVQEGDQVDDLFSGTGVMARVFEDRMARHSDEQMTFAA